jgi:hypothetical protein
MHFFLEYRFVSSVSDAHSATVFLPPIYPPCQQRINNTGKKSLLNGIVNKASSSVCWNRLIGAARVPAPPHSMPAMEAGQAHAAAKIQVGDTHE